MAPAQRLAARGGGVGRLPSHSHDWPDEDAGTPSRVERRRIQREVIQGSTRMGIYAPAWLDDHALTKRPVTTARLERTQPAQSVPLPMPAELAEALDELDDVTAYAEEIEVETPSAAAFDNARCLLKAMYSISPRQFSVYPVAGGRIALDTRGSIKGRIAVVSCGSDGSVLCLVTIDGKHRRARYSANHNLPDGFIREALDEL